MQNFPEVIHHVVNATLSITALETDSSEHIYNTHILSNSIDGQFLANLLCLAAYLCPSSNTVLSILFQINHFAFTSLILQVDQYSDFLNCEKIHNLIFTFLTIFKCIVQWYQLHSYCFTAVTTIHPQNSSSYTTEIQCLLNYSSPKALASNLNTYHSTSYLYEFDKSGTLQFNDFSDYVYVGGGQVDKLYMYEFYFRILNRSFKIFMIKKRN